jgi:Arabinose efflux permease
MTNKIFLNRNFTFLWLGKIISKIGDEFYFIALSWWILQKTESPGIMGFFLLVSVLPGLLFGLFSGAMADRWNRKNVLILSDLIRGLLVLMVVLLSKSGLLLVWHVFLIGAALSLMTAFFDPAAQAIIPQLVVKENWKEANSLMQAANAICTILGPVLGAVSISIFGVTAVFLFNSISFFLSAFFEKMLHYNSKTNPSVRPQSILSDVKDGILFLKNSRSVMNIIIIVATTHFFMGSLMVHLPFLSKALNGNGVKNLGCLQAVLGIGLLSGAIYIGKRKSAIMKETTLFLFIMYIGFCFSGIGILQLFSILSIMPYIVVFFLIGCGISIASVFWQSLIQLNTPEHMTGRIFGVSSLAANVSLPLAYGVFGILLSYSSISVLMLISGCSLLLLFSLLIIPKAKNSVFQDQRQNNL